MQALKKSNTWGPPCSVDMETRQDTESERLKVNVICLISPVEEASLQFRRFECRVFTDVRPNEQYCGVKLGEAIPIEIEGQDSWLTAELCQFDEKKRRSNDPVEEENDSDFLKVNPDLLKELHNEGEPSDADSESHPEPDAVMDGARLVEKPNTSGNMRQELDHILSHFRRRQGLPSAEEPNFNLNAQRARPSGSSEGEEEEIDTAPRRKRRRKRCVFIDDMAEASSLDSSEDESDESVSEHPAKIAMPGSKHTATKPLPLSVPKLERSRK